MKIDFNFEFKDLDGNAIAQFHAGKTVSHNLANSQSGDAVKFYGWALKLHALEVLDLDDSDVQTFKSFIEAQQFTALVKVQLLKIFDKK
jgi:hypothetical protein